MSDLTNRQKEILEFIKRQVKSKGYPPSIREIADKVGLNSSGTVHSHLHKIEKLGYIKRDPSKPRAIEVIEKKNYAPGLNQEILEFPVVEKINGGINPVSKKNIIDIVKLPASLIVGENNFILKYKENKMENKIINGDYLIVNRTENIKENRIGVFLIKYFKTIVGRCSVKGDDILINFDNEWEDPLIINKKDVNIIGEVTGIFRTIK